MRLCFLFSFCIVLCLGSKFESGTTPNDIRDGYFRGRSGTLTFKPDSAQNLDMSAIFVDKSGQHFDSTTGDISVSDFTDMIGSAIGVQPIDPTHSSTKTHLFNKAQANVLFVVESLGRETLNKFDLQNLNAPSNNQWGGTLAFKKSVPYTVYPADALSTAASLASGKTPSLHGVVARRWRNKATGEKVEAFADKTAFGQVANLADIVAQTFSGQSILLSSSGDWQHAKLHSVNPNTKYSSFILTVSQNGVENIDGSPVSHQLSLSRSQLIQSLQGTSILSALSGDVTVSVQGDQVTVQFPSTWGSNRDTSVFSLQSSVDFLFFAELQYFYSLPALLTANGMHSDNAPDLYCLTFSSLTGLIEHYGRDSQEVRSALHLLNAALPKIMAKYMSAYSGDVVGEVVFLGSHLTSFQTDDTRDLIEHLTTLMPKQEGVKEFFPSLYLDDEQATRMCQTESELLPLAVQPYSFSVYCPWLALATRKTSFAFHPYVLMSSAAATNSSNSTVTDNDIQIYQVTLWISIIMAFTLYWAVYTLGFMSFKKDTLLYSTFNPGWEDRKRR